MYDESVPTKDCIEWVTQFDSWLVGLSHFDNIAWREGGEGSSRIDFGSPRK